MRGNRAKVCVFALLLVLAGCAGKDFVRPDTAMLKNGQTTQAQVAATFGRPFAEGSGVKNEKTVKSASYAYAAIGGKPAHDGVVAARGMSFYFVDDILVGYEFISSWAGDQTDFDEGKVNQIVKGKTTQPELVQLLGKPGGYYIYPMIKSTTGQAAVYAYAEVGGSMFNRKTYRKMLVVTFDDAGVVADVDFSATGTK